LKYIMERVEGQIPSHKPEPMFPAKWPTTRPI
jgi:hypothetical protein